MHRACIYSIHCWEEWPKISYLVSYQWKITPMEKDATECVTIVRRMKIYWLWVFGSHSDFQSFCRTVVGYSNWNYGLDMTSKSTTHDGSKNTPEITYFKYRTKCQQMKWMRSGACKKYKSNWKKAESNTDIHGMDSFLYNLWRFRCFLSLNADDKNDGCHTFTFQHSSMPVCVQLTESGSKKN